VRVEVAVEVALVEGKREAVAGEDDNGCARGEGDADGSVDGEAEDVGSGSDRLPIMTASSSLCCFCS